MTFVTDPTEDAARAEYTREAPDFSWDDLADVYRERYRERVRHVLDGSGLLDRLRAAERNAQAISEAAQAEATTFRTNIAALRSRVEKAEQARDEVKALLPSLVSFALAAPSNLASIAERDRVVENARAVLGEGSSNP